MQVAPLLKSQETRELDHVQRECFLRKQLEIERYSNESKAESVFLENQLLKKKTLEVVDAFKKKIFKLEAEITKIALETSSVKDSNELGQRKLRFLLGKCFDWKKSLLYIVERSNSDVMEADIFEQFAKNSLHLVVNDMEHSISLSSGSDSSISDESSSVYENLNSKLLETIQNPQLHQQIMSLVVETVNGFLPILQNKIMLTTSAPVVEAKIGGAALSETSSTAASNRSNVTVRKSQLPRKKNSKESTSPHKAPMTSSSVGSEQSVVQPAPAVSDHRIADLQAQVAELQKEREALLQSSRAADDKMKQLKLKFIGKMRDAEQSAQQKSSEVRDLQSMLAQQEENHRLAVEELRQERERDLAAHEERKGALSLQLEESQAQSNARQAQMEQALDEARLLWHQEQERCIEHARTLEEAARQQAVDQEQCLQLRSELARAQGAVSTLSSLLGIDERCNDLSVCILRIVETIQALIAGSLAREKKLAEAQVAADAADCFLIESRRQYADDTAQLQEEIDRLSKALHCSEEAVSMHGATEQVRVEELMQQLEESVTARKASHKKSIELIESKKLLVKQLEESCDESAEKRRELELEKWMLMQEVEAANASIKSLSDKCAASTALEEELQAQFCTLRSERDESKASAVAASARADEAEFLADKLQKENDEYAAELRKLRHDMQEEVNSWQDKVQQLREELVQGRDTEMSRTNELRALAERIQQFSAERSTMKAEVDEGKSKVKELLRVVDFVKSKAKTHSAQLKEANQALKKETKVQQEICSTLQAEVDELKAQLAQTSEVTAPASVEDRAAMTDLSAAQMAAQEEECAQLRVRLQSYQLSTDEREAEAAQLRLHSARCEKDLAERCAELTVLQQSHLALEAEKAELESVHRSAVSDSERQLSELAAALATAQQRAAAEANEKELLMAQYAEKQACAEQALLNLRISEDAHQQTLVQIQTLQFKLKNAEAKSLEQQRHFQLHEIELLNSVEGLQTAEQQLTFQLEECRQQLEWKSHELASLQNHLNEVSQQASLEAIECSDSQSQLIALNQELSALKKEGKERTKKSIERIRDLTQQLSAKSCQLEESQLQIRCLQDQLELEKAQHVLSVEQQLQAQRELTGRIEQLQQLLEQSRSADGQADHAHAAEMDRLQSELVALRGQMKSRALQSVEKIKKLQDRIAALEGECSVQLSKVSELTEAIACLEKQASEARCELESKNSQLVASLEELSEKYAATKERSALKSQEIQRLTKIVNTERDQFNRLKRSMNKLVDIRNAVCDGTHHPLPSPASLSSTKELLAMPALEDLEAKFQSGTATPRADSRMTAEFVSIQEALDRKLAEIRSGDGVEVADPGPMSKVSSMEMSPISARSDSVKLCRRLSALHRELEEKIDECELAKQQLREMEFKYSELQQQLMHDRDLYGEGSLQKVVCQECIQTAAKLAREEQQWMELEAKSIECNMLRGRVMELESRITSIQMDISARTSSSQLLDNNLKEKRSAAQIHELESKMSLLEGDLRKEAVLKDDALRKFDTALRKIKELERQEDSFNHDREDARRDIISLNRRIEEMEQLYRSQLSELNQSECKEFELYALRQSFAGFVLARSISEVETHGKVMCRILGMSEEEQQAIISSMMRLAPIIIAYTSLETISTDFSNVFETIVFGEAVSTPKKAPRDRNIWSPDGK